MIYDANNRPIPLARAARKAKGQVKALLSGFKGANSEDLYEWAYLPLDINQTLRNDLRILRARSRDLARNDDTAVRFLNILKQNVLGHAGIILKPKNKLRNGKPDKRWNSSIEAAWRGFMAKRRRSGGYSEAPSACGQLSGVQIAWLEIWNRAIDGECFIQILRGYPHNRDKFAVRFINPDLLDSSFCDVHNGNRVEMGIEFDEYDRPVAYHFSENPSGSRLSTQLNPSRVRIPASQIIHTFKKEWVGQIRGIPAFACIMHKQKMLNGLHEAIVIGWRVAAAKMGFFTTSDPELSIGELDESTGEMVLDATPGSFEKIPDGFSDLKIFDPDYPTSSYEMGNTVFMRQMANGLNVSSPTLANDYSGVNYSSLRQALLEDRGGWRCMQRESIDDLYMPLFDLWYPWARDITRLVSVPAAKASQEPDVAWQPRGWPWVDPLKEVNAHVKAIDANLRTHQSVMADTDGSDFAVTIETLAEERETIAASTKENENGDGDNG